MAKVSREDIQAVFERLVDQQGLDQVSMKQLAREAGISVGTIYLHFKSKDDLVAAYEQRWTQHVKLWNARIIESDRSPETKLHDIILDHIKQFSALIHEKRGVYELLMGAQHLRYLGRLSADTRREMFGTFVANAIRIMEEGCAQGVFEISDIPGTANHYVGAFFLYFTPEVLRHHDPEELRKGAEGMFRFLMKAIRGS